MTAELILDGVHVHPDVARLLLDAAPGRVALITDAMAAAGAADGTLQARLARRRRDGRRGPAEAAGRLARLDRGLDADPRSRAAGGDARCGMSLPAAVAALTWVPARVLGLDDRLGRLAPGYAADAVLLERRVRGAGGVGAGLRLA